MDFEYIIASVISSVAIGLAIYGIKKFGAFIDVQIKKIKNADLRNALLSASDELENAVSLAVTEVGEIYVKGLKAEGKFTEIEAKEAANKAIQRTKEIMSASGTTILMDAQVDVDAYIKAKLENLVKENK